MFKSICRNVIILATTLAIVVSGCSTGPVKNVQQLKAATDSMQKAIQARLEKFDSDLAEASTRMTGTGLTGNGAREILEGLCRKHSFLVDTAAQDNSGTMVTLAPASARQYEGVNTGKNEVSTEFFTNVKPLLSNMFKAAQGYQALVLVRPVGTVDGRLMGSISGLFRPEDLVGDIIAPQASAAGIEVNFMQVDGVVMYSTDGHNTGKNVLTDPSFNDYPELVAQVRKITEQKTGTGTYLSHGQQPGTVVKKAVYWTTVGLHGTEYRLASVIELGN